MSSASMHSERYARTLGSVWWKTGRSLCSVLDGLEVLLDGVLVPVGLNKLGCTADDLWVRHNQHKAVLTLAACPGLLVEDKPHLEVQRRVILHFDDLEVVDREHGPARQLLTELHLH